MTAVAAAALAASFAALTSTPTYASQVRAQEQRPSTPNVTWTWGSGGSRAVLLSSALAVRPHPASVSSLPAAGRITATRELTRDLRRYRAPALLVIALMCLIALITLRIRRRRAAKKHPLDGTGEPIGRHGVAGPAGSGEVPVGWPNFVPFSDNNRGVPPAAAGRSNSEGSSLGDQVADKFDWYGPARAEETQVEEAPTEKAPAEEAPAEQAHAEEAHADGGAPTWDMPPGPLPSRRSQRRDNGTRPAPGGPPWEPAEKPPGEFPWAPTNPGNLAQAGDRGTIPPRLSYRPDDATDGPPATPPSGTRS